MLKSKVLVLLFVLLSNLYAKEKEETSLEVFLKETNYYREETYKRFLETAKNIDEYLSDGFNTKKTNYKKNYILIEASAKNTQSEFTSYNQKVKVRLYLPRLQKKYQVLFESEEENEINKQIERKEEVVNYDLVINIRKKVKKNLYFNTKIGLKLVNKLDPFISTKVLRSWPIDNRIYTLRQDIKYSYYTRLKTTSSFIYENLLDDKYTFIYKNQYFWHSTYPKDNIFFTLFSLRKNIDKKNSLSYNFDLNINNKEDTSLRLKRYSYYIAYKYKIKKWLHSDLVYEHFFRDDLDFDLRYAIGFKLSLFIK